jgi:ribosome recycling factor
MDALVKELENHLKKVVAALKGDLRGIRSGRPTPELLENVKVSVYEQPLSIKELGSLSIRPPREIIVTVWDQNVIAAVLKAIQDAQVGLTPNVEGNTIRCPLPPLTQERREELSRHVRKLAEEVRIKIRTLRDEANKKIKVQEPDEDQVFKAKERVQKLVDEANGEVETLVEGKIRELQE